ncbi:ubiquinol-cytochrome c reductase iron-sulfur subunit [Metabacillus sp. GX 13764]|uniref:QcrA and Rieske domain-containing protein n=1 Tax=Metabacillus kandeliae TaxID=2900151 RepID=UPI001E48B928|nr:ubiquinol-cytochrome c reductase iron-sulfur subunit [Metabacillus kandeliae]MCD7033381.1 ubiquinol-cytochrome c reductase iron-sulfur subunit [Metabacillus kandeliae]
MSERKPDVSRRQFLNYTLTGVGGFMAAGISMPLIRFALDPVLEPAAAQGFVQVVKADEITNEPQRFDYKIKQTDAWYKSEVSKSAWVFKDPKGEIVALSPICKHLGCTVNWKGDPKTPNEFYCPCHGGRYEKDGTNIPGTPPQAPLDRYEHQIKDGYLYLGAAKPKGGA